MKVELGEEYIREVTCIITVDNSHRTSDRGAKNMRLAKMAPRAGDTYSKRMSLVDSTAMLV